MTNATTKTTSAVQEVRKPTTSLRRLPSLFLPTILRMAFHSITHSSADKMHIIVDRAYLHHRTNQQRCVCMQSILGLGGDTISCVSGWTPRKINTDGNCKLAWVSRAKSYTCCRTEEEEYHNHEYNYEYNYGYDFDDVITTTVKPTQSQSTTKTATTTTTTAIPMEKNIFL